MPSPTVQQHLAECARHIGTRGNFNIFNHWYWCELNGYSRDPGTAWCAAFQSYCANRSGLKATPSASAAAFATQFPRVADRDVQPGDIVLFNWDGRSDLNWADHVGIVEWSDINGTGYFGTIEGNTGNSECKRVTRNNNASYFTAFFRPEYGTPEPEKPKVEEDKVKVVSNAGGPVYRLYDPNDGNHMFTANKAEHDILDAAGWNSEGIVWNAPKGGVLPVYRMYAPHNGDHMLTTSFAEADEAQELHGYKYEGVPFFADDKTGKPVYRLLRKDKALHHYTASKEELERLKKNGWNDEGVAFYMH